MADKEKPQPPQTGTAAPAAPELNNPDFQVVLKALLAAYQPILEQQLNLAKNPEALQKEAQSHPPNCADEFAQADALFRKFFNEDVALRMLPARRPKTTGTNRKLALVLGTHFLLLRLWLAGLPWSAYLPGLGLLRLPVLAVRSARPGHSRRKSAHRRAE